MPQASLPRAARPLVLGSFRPIGLKVEMLFLFPKKPDITISKLQKSYTPSSTGGGRWWCVSPAIWAAIIPAQNR